MDELKSLETLFAECITDRCNSKMFITELAVFTERHLRKIFNKMEYSSKLPLGRVRDEFLICPKQEWVEVRDYLCYILLLDRNVREFANSIKHEPDSDIKCVMTLRNINIEHPNATYVIDAFTLWNKLMDLSCLTLDMEKIPTGGKYSISDIKYTVNSASTPRLNVYKYHPGFKSLTGDNIPPGWYECASG